MTDAELGKLAEIPPLSELYSFYNQTNTGLFSGWLYDYFTQKLAALRKVSEADRAELAKQVDRNAEYLHNLKRLRGAKEVAEAQLAECQKERDEAKRHIYLASGFAMRSGRELEIATALEETPESDRDSADNTIGELLDMIDAGRSVVSRLTAEVERLRECEADTKRLDWLDKDRSLLTIAATVGGWKFVRTHGTIDVNNHNDGLRAAIDWAMSNPANNPEKQQ